MVKIEIVGVRNERCLRTYAKNKNLLRNYKRWVVYAKAKKQDDYDVYYKDTKLKIIFVGKLYQVRQLLWESKNGRRILQGLDSEIKEKWLI